MLYAAALPLLVKDYKSPCALDVFQTQVYWVCNFPEKLAPAPWRIAVVLETPQTFQLCPPSPSAQRVATSEMVSVCLVPAGAEHGNWSHAKKTASHPAVPRETLSHYSNKPWVDRQVFLPLWIAAPKRFTASSMPWGPSCLCTYPDSSWHTCWQSPLSKNCSSKVSSVQGTLRAGLSTSPDCDHTPTSLVLIVGGR